MRLATSAVLLICGTVVATAGSARTAEMPLWALTASPLCSGIENELQCAQAIEANQLPAYTDAAWRTCDTLFVAGADSLHRFVDEVRAAPEAYGLGFTSFLHAFSDPPLVFLHRVAGADWSLLLLDTAADTTIQIRSWPRIAPDGAHFVLVEPCAIDFPSVIEIWGIGPLQREWSRSSYLRCIDD
jgi:hypothetical protein